MKQYLSSIMKVVSLVGLFFVANAAVMACSCEPASDCRSYAESKGIFLGVVSEVIDDPLQANITVTFTPKKVFKGSLGGGMHTLTFRSGSCRKMFKPGELYLVFQDDQLIQSICNRTAPASESASSLDFLKQVQSASLRQQIAAVIVGLSVDEMSKTEFWINENKGSFEVLSSRVAKFSHGKPKLAKAKVRLRLPFRVEIRATDGFTVLTPAMKVSSEGEKTTIEYEVDLGCVVCDFRRIELIR